MQNQVKNNIPKGSKEYKQLASFAMALYNALMTPGKSLIVNEVVFAAYSAALVEIGKISTEIIDEHIVNVLAKENAENPTEEQRKENFRNN